MSDTPKIDDVMLSRNEGVREVFDAHEPYFAWTDYWALGECARQLERELEQTRAELREARKAIGNVESACAKEMERAEAAEAKNAELNAKSDRERTLVEAARFLLDTFERGEAGFPPHAEIRINAKEVMRAALAPYESGKEEG